MKNQRGFTKIEILVIVGIVGLLGVIAVFSVLAARSRTRDAVRISDIRQIQGGLELHFIDTNNYPPATEVMPIGTAAASCLGDKGFSVPCADGDIVYLEVVPFTPEAGLKGTTSCGGYSNAYCYLSDGEDYSLQFELENKNSLLGLSKGVNCAKSTGLEPGPCGTTE